MYLSLRDRPGGATPHDARTTASRVSSVVVTLGIVSMLTDMSSESVVAVLPLYVTATLGLSTIAYGFIDGLMQGASALVRILGGWAADRLDRPKWVAFFGYGVSALTRGALLFAAGFGAITALVTFDRIGKGFRTAPRDAIITASSNRQFLGRSFGVHRTLDTVGAALGPLMAFVVLWEIPNGYSTVFVASFACALLGLAALGLLVPDVRPRAKLGGPKVERVPIRWRHVLGGPARPILIAAAVLGLLTVGDGFIYLALQSRDGFATRWFPLLYVGTNIGYLGLAIPVGRLADRVGRAKVLVIGHLGLVAAYAVAAMHSGGTRSTLLCLLLMGTFYAATDGVLAAIAGRVSSDESRASTIAAAQTVTAVARMIASSAFGLLWYTIGRSSALDVVALALVVAVPACYLLTRRLDRDVAADDAAAVEANSK